MSKYKEAHPDPFLEVIVHDLKPEPGLVGLCAGYQLGKWRKEQLAGHICEWLPEFALTYSERRAIQDSNAAALIKKAAKAVYDTDKYRKRGEFGEILLHIILRQIFGTLPAISKIFFKDGPNETVKGFDAVHVVAAENDLELWLGEVKFYKNISKAITDVVSELKSHAKANYFKKELTFIENKIDDKWPHAEKLKKLLHRNESLDKVFSRVTIPVLLTYDSATVSAHRKSDQAYKDAIKNELRTHHAKFIASELPKGIKIHLMLLPLKSKDQLTTEIHGRLQAWQNI